VVGVLSKGSELPSNTPDCGVEGRYGVYTRISKYSDFLREIMFVSSHAPVESCLPCPFGLFPCKSGVLQGSRRLQSASSQTSLAFLQSGRPLSKGCASSRQHSMELLGNPLLNAPPPHPPPCRMCPTLARRAPARARGRPVGTSRGRFPGRVRLSNSCRQRPSPTRT
jgi:hypothetical protein